MTIDSPGQVSTPTPLILSNIDVDYDDIGGAFVKDLQVQGSWSNLLQAGTGMALIRWISTVTATLRGGVARALQEVYPDTARTPGGVLRAQRLFQGSSILRRRASSVQVQVSRVDSSASNLSVGAYQQWRVGNIQFFNRYPVVIPATGSATITLYRGEIVTASVVSDGSAFQRFVIGTPDQWDLSNDDITCVDASGVQWQSTLTGLWKYDDTALVFRASTLTDGTVECRFGNGTYGSVPPVGPITFIYASLESTQNTLVSPPAGSAVVPQNADATVRGVTVTTPGSNQDQPGPEFYKAIGPGQASNNGRAVSRPDYRAMALKYDGVVDAVFRAQKEKNPSDVRWMNVVAVSLLTTSPWNEQQWLAFKAYFERQVGISNVYLVREDPSPKLIDFEILIGASLIANLDDLNTLIDGIIDDYLTPRAGIIGSTVYPSDVTLRIQQRATYQVAPNESGTYIDYVNPVLPLGPVYLGPTDYPVKGVVQVNSVYSQRGPENIRTGNVPGS